MAKEPTGAREELATDRASCRVAATRCLALVGAVPVLLTFSLSASGG